MIYCKIALEALPPAPHQLLLTMTLHCPCLWI